MAASFIGYITQAIVNNFAPLLFVTFQKSFDEIYALKPEQLQLGFLKVLKGSYMFEHKEEYQVIYESNNIPVSATDT